MLDAAEALLLRRRDKLAVAHERGGEVAVKSIEAQDDHMLNSTFCPEPSFTNDSDHRFRKRRDPADTNEPNIVKAGL